MLEAGKLDDAEIDLKTKHIAVKYHWFREKLEELNVVILRVDTKEQLADIFTKGLTFKEFATKRKLVCGW